MSGDFRKRIVSPASIPLIALIFIGILTWSLSRVLLSVDREAAVIIAILVAAEILAGSAIIAARRRIRSQVLGGVLALALVALVTTGVVASEVVGELPVGEEEARGNGERDGGGETDGGAKQPRVDVVDNRFDAKEITVPAGTAIVWEQTGREPHTVTADDDSFDSHPECLGFSDASAGKCMATGDSFDRSFEEPGRYPYYCRIHGAPGGAGMAGVVIVE